TPDAFAKAIKYLEEAINMEPEYAIAYSSLSFCYLTMLNWGWLPPEQSLPETLKAAYKALELDDQIAESYLAIGRVRLFNEYRLKEAATEFKKALAINQNSAECHIQLGWCATHLGNHAEAQLHADMAESLDPFSLMNLYLICVIHWTAGALDLMEEYSKRMIDLEPNFFAGHQMLGMFYVISGRFEEAIRFLELCLTLNYDVQGLCNLGVLYGRLGEKSKAREIIEKMKKLERIETTGAVYLGQVYASMGELDKAFQYFDEAIDNRVGHMLFCKYFLRDMGLLEDPRTKRMLDRMGVPL
ncbi:MAG: tetratricopeptide repeat protein, partial [Muriicola sp.]